MDLSVYFQKGGLVPVVVQDAQTKDVLMLGYADEEALRRTLTTGKAWFWSRSRQRRWCKGETSGHFLLVEKVLADCDDDTILVLARPLGPTCHTGNTSCFFKTIGGE
jgi:phosphoribosyl-AMP cyclohydrolase